MGVCFRASEDSILASSERAFGPSGKSKSIPTVGESSKSTSPKQNGSPTSESAEPQISPELTSSPAASLARTSAMPASGLESTESEVGCGLNMRESFANFDRATSSWRTSQLCFTGELSEFSETWPCAGMTRSGKAFELPTLEHHIGENESGSWPTPTVEDAWGGNPDNPTATERNLASLRNAVKVWPTPTANRWDGLQSHGVNVVSGQLNPTWVEWLMGYPLGWTDCGDSGTRSSRKFRNGSGDESSK
jgi:hypothetical protein